jgi:hypothetical protein
MIKSTLLKEIILSNEDYILNKIPSSVVERNIALPSKKGKVVIFYGVRRSGKSYILYDIFRKNKEKAVYLDFEDERLSEFSINDFDKIKEVFYEAKPELIGKEIVMLLDEVQNVQGWEKYARRVTERENVQVFVTGSSSKIMPKEIQTALRGRSWSLEIMPFSFQETLAMHRIDPKQMLTQDNKARMKNYFNQYMNWGGFPEVLLSKTEFEKIKILKEYLDAMFVKDLVERFRITNVHLLTVMMDNLFSSFASKFSLTSFWKHYHQKFPFSKDSLFLYYKYLLDSMLICEVRKISESSYKRNRNPAKVYLIDTGLCKHLYSNDLGRVLENTVFLELRKRSQEIFYYEENGECDFVIKEFSGRMIPFQVTYELNPGNEEREFAGIEQACKKLSLKKGVILTYNQELIKKYNGINIKAVPFWKWILDNRKQA